MRYQAILFDLDNTLYDYDAYWRQRLLWSLEPLRLYDSLIDLTALIQRMMSEHIYAQQLQAFLEQEGIKDGELVANIHKRYRINNYKHLSLYSGAEEILEDLHRSYKLGIITNGPIQTQRAKIVQFALAQHMDVILISEEVGIAKPDPAIFRLALSHLHIEATATLFVGDSLEFDLIGAHATGIDFVWMNTTGSILPEDMPQPVAVIQDLKQLRPLLNLMSI